MPQIQSPHSTKFSEPDGLIREFREYSQNWAVRMNKAGLDSKSKTMALQTFDELMSRVQASVKGPSSLPTRIHEFITSNLHKGLTLQDLSEFLGYSEKYCSELFHTQMGETFSVYIKRVRIDRAKRYLEDENLSLTLIAESLGFKDPFAFSHFFKKATGDSPRHFRTKKFQKKRSSCPQI